MTADDVSMAPISPRQGGLVVQSLDAVTRKTAQLTIDQAAILFNRSRRTVYAWLRSGKLASLDPADVRDLLYLLRKPPKGRPRGRPFGS